MEGPWGSVNKFGRGKGEYGLSIKQEDEWLDSVVSSEWFQIKDNRLICGIVWCLRSDDINDPWWGVKSYLL